MSSVACSARFFPPELLDVRGRLGSNSREHLPMEPVENPTVDASHLRSRMLYRLFAAPSVSVPLWLGAAALLAAVLTGNPTGYLGVLGLASVLFAFASAGIRWTLGHDRLRAAANEELETEAARNHTLYLHYLWRRLRVDGDPRTRQYLEQMRRLYQRMQRAGVLGKRADSRLSPEICEKTERLYQSCLAALERTHDYWTATRQMATAEGRREAVAAREALLAEVGRSLERLNATLDHLQAAALRREDQTEQLASIREELDEGLEVAKRVEERMEELDRSLRGYRELE